MAVQLLPPRRHTHRHRHHAGLLEPEATPLNDASDALPAPLAGVVERLYRDYPTVALGELISLVRRCRADIDTGAPEDYIPELVERIARVRLTDAM